MSQWAKRLKESPVWTRFDELGAAIDSSVKRDGISPEQVGDIERIRAVLAFAGKRFAALDPLLVVPEQFPPIDDALSGATAQLRSYADNGNVDHIAHANQQADTALRRVAELNWPATPIELQGLSDAASKYRATLEDELRRAQESANKLREQMAAVATRLAELSGELAAEKQKTAAATSEFQAQFSQGQNDRSRQSDEFHAQRQQRFDDFFAEVRARANSLQSTWTEEHAAGQATRQQKFDELLARHTELLANRSAEYDSASNTLWEELQKTHETLKTEYTGKAEALLEQVRRHEEDAKSLLGVIGTDGIKSGYLQTANSAKSSTHFWQFVTVVAMLGLIGVAILTLFAPPNPAVSWVSQFAARAFVAIAFGVLATFAASQTARYSEIERRNRKLGLELEALGPFVAPLSEEAQATFRVALGNRTFGQDDRSIHTVNPSPATALDALLTSKELRELVTDIVKAARS